MTRTGMVLLCASMLGFLGCDTNHSISATIPVQYMPCEGTTVRGHSTALEFCSGIDVPALQDYVCGGYPWQHDCRAGKMTCLEKSRRLFIDPQGRGHCLRFTVPIPEELQ